MFEVAVGATDVTVYVYFVDDDGGTAPGEPTTGLLFSNIETGGSASTMRQGAARADFTLVTQSVAGAHTDGGFIEVDATNMPGIYRLDLPDVFGSGADFVIADLVEAGANNTIMRPVVIRIRDNPSVSVAQWLGTAVATPNTAGVPLVDLVRIVGGLVPTPTTAGVPDVNVERWLDTLVTLGAGAPDVNVQSMDANVITTTAINAAALDGKGDWNIGKTGYSLTQAFPTNFADLSIVITTGLVDITQTAADKVWSTATRTLTAFSTALALSVWDVLESAIVTASSIGLKLKNNLDAAITSRSSHSAADVWTAGTRNLTALGFNLGASDFNAGAIDANALATDAVNEIRDAILPKTNTALNDIPFVMVLTSDHVTPATGLTVTATRSIDGGTTFAATTGVVTEAANGVYHFDASAADMNGALVTFKFSAATADDTFVSIRTGG